MVHRDTYRIQIGACLSSGSDPSVGNSFQRGDAMAFVAQADNPALACDVKPARPPNHANAGGNLVVVIFEKRGRGVLEAIAIGVLKLKNISVIAQREKPSVRSVNQV